jgi:predicted dehydrogenase
LSSIIRWGILGPGNIATKFAEGLQSADDAELIAVGSRSADRADAFADRFGAPKRHASYDALVEDPDVDAIYVATPHPYHKQNSIACLEAGKAVLCEKPFTINRAEAEAVVNVARREGVFLMEAMWTRCLPVMQQVREWIADGAIGDVRMVTADFGYRVGQVNPESRIFSPHLGGGGLLDVGIYPISFARMIFGRPSTAIASRAEIGTTGVDEQAAIILDYDGGMAICACAVRTTTTQRAEVIGTSGRITIHPPFWRGSEATLVSDGEEETVKRPYKGNGYTHEAEEVGRCLRSGELESPLLPLDETVELMGTLDEIRAQWGLKYPMEG